MSLVEQLKELKNFRKTGNPSDGQSAVWKQPYETLRQRWNAVPTTKTGVESTTKLLALPDHELLEAWEKARQDITTGGEFAHRGWYHALYADGMRGKRVMDVGSGFGVDSITFAQHFPDWTSQVHQRKPDRSAFRAEVSPGRSPDTL